jgi:geranylgeranyl pyrophosphate synthase
MTGAHAAQILLAGLSASDELKIKVLAIVNLAMITTAHGQTYDIINELRTDVPLEDIEHVLEWKTAHYSFLNPLCVGMVLAGADCAATDAIRDYALNAGKAFQIADDIRGIFGNDKDNGKSAMDDIREGKRTLLTSYALESATESDAVFLKMCLGNPGLSRSEFTRCKEIIEVSGALAYAQTALQI